MIHVDKFGDIYVIHIDKFGPEMFFLLLGTYMIHIDKFGPLITERFLAKNINSLQEWALSR